MVLLLLSLLTSLAHATSTFDDVVVENSCIVPSLTQGDNSTKAANTAYVDTAVAGATISDATTLVKGKVKLAGDLAGTADLPTVPGLSGKEASISAGTTAQYWRGDKSFQTLNTAAVPESGNLYWTQARFDAAFGAKSTTDLAEGSNLFYTAARFNTAFAAKTTTDLTEGSNLYYTAARFNTALGTKSTSDLSEGSNLYFTNARVDTEFDTRLATKSTSNLAEGVNLYYTQARFDSALAAKSTSNLTEGSNLYFTNARVDTEFDTRLATKSTTNLAEGSNLYYTDARVKSAAAAAMPVQQMYVTKDNGNDANDGSLLKPFKTIQAAITAANAISAYYKPVVIHVAPSFGGTGSSYNENITFSQQGVNLVCDAPQASQRACQISGTVTVNMTGTSGGANFVAASNEAYMNGFVVGVNSAGATLTFSGTTFQRFILLNSYIDQNGAGNAVVMTNSGTSSGSASLLKVFDSDINNSNATAPAVDLQVGKLWLYGTTSTISNGNAAGPSVTQSGATTSFIANLVQLTGQYNLTSNTATATFNLSTIASGTNPCIVTPASPNTGYALLAYSGCNTSASPSITGTGVVVFATGNACVGTGCSTASTVTTTSLGKLPEGGVFLKGSTGALTSLSTNEIVGYGKTVRAVKIENMVGAAAVFTTCTTNPTFTLYDCGTSAGACTAGRTALANVTLTAANTGTNGTVTSATLAAGHYWAVEISAGACAALNANVSAEGANQ